jgi:hypothetical protein
MVKLVSAMRLCRNVWMSMAMRRLNFNNCNSFTHAAKKTIETQ